jgi:hypothetical protein
MLHVRVVSPPSTTGALLDKLAVVPGVQNLIVLDGAARRLTAMPSFSSCRKARPIPSSGPCVISVLTATARSPWSR